MAKKILNYVDAKKEISIFKIMIDLVMKKVFSTFGGV